MKGIPYSHAWLFISILCLGYLSVRGQETAIKKLTEKLFLKADANNEYCPHVSQIDYIDTTNKECKQTCPNGKKPRKKTIPGYYLCCENCKMPQVKIVMDKQRKTTVTCTCPQ